jgi:signal transduction histidine kinase
MIAHQWRQPLSLISTASGHIYILNQFDNITPDELSKQLGIIQDATQKLSNIIEDFKTFFQPNTKKSDENIKSVIDDAIYFMSVSFGDNNIKVENNLAQLDTKIVSIYKNNIIQVVTNLLKNSIEAMEFEEVKKIKISNKIDDGNYIITIEDSGCGIAFDISDKVFEPYFSTKSKNERGLGLYMCKTIIEDYHQGKIYFENVGQGVRFILKLPIVS